MKCHDCGELFEKVTHTRRYDICDACWETRGALVRGEICELGGETFKKIQRKMARRNGTAKVFIDSIGWRPEMPNRSPIDPVSFPPPTGKKI